MEKKNLRLSRKIFFLLAMVSLLSVSCQMQQPSNDTIEQLVSTVSHPEWSKNAVLYEVNVRQFTPEGTFNAFAEHLPRLKEMGVNILWFMPVTPIGEVERKGTLGSYYSVQDYKGINPEFGTKEDFQNLVNQIHEMGMYVIIDWVANHTAWDHPWVQTNPAFYYTDANGNFTPPHDTDWSDVIQLDYENHDLWDAMISDMRYWLEEVNIDGFRCDVAYLVPAEFWNRARRELDSVKPIFMLAEADHPELMEHAFNAGYSWTSHHAMNSIARGDQNVSALDNYFFGKPLENEDQKEKEVQAVTYTFERSVNHYPIGTYKINFISNHDENSWAGTVFDRLGDAMEVFAVLSNTVEGMFLLYNGQEAGLDKMLEFFEKDEIDWSDLKYQDFYTRLFDLKAGNRALWNGLAGGKMKRVNTNDDNKIFAFTREKDGDKVFVVLNLSAETNTVNFSGGDFTGTYTELFTEEIKTIASDFSLAMDPWTYKVYFK
jgi:glycosidase